MKGISISDIYNTLPKTNCGECGYPTCYTFALNVLLKGEDIKKCPYVSEEALKALSRDGINIKPEERKLWEEPLKVLRERIRSVDFKSRAEDIGGEYGEDGRGRFILLEYMGKKLRVYEDDIIKDDGSEIDPWVKVLIFNYILGGGRGSPEGRWTSFADLPMGRIKYKSFVETVEKPLARLFDEKPEKITRLKEALKAETTKLGDEDISLIFHPLPKIPALILFWKRDNEEGFPPKVRMLFDGSSGRFLDIESIAFLGEELVKLTESL